jgi:anthranilate phosphoribosyltransferase
MQDLRGGEPEENARILRNLLEGRDETPRRDVVLLNAALALATQHGDIERGLREARHSLESGVALSKLNALAEFSQRCAPESSAVH